MGKTNRLIGYCFGGCLVIFFVATGLIKGREYLLDSHRLSAAMLVEATLFALPGCLIGLGLYLLWGHYLAQHFRKR